MEEKGLLILANGLRICKYMVNCIRRIYSISLSSLLTVSKQDHMCLVYDYVPST